MLVDVAVVARISIAAGAFAGISGNLNRLGILRKLSIETGDAARFLPVAIASYEILMFVQEYSAWPKSCIEIGR